MKNPSQALSGKNISEKSFIEFAPEICQILKLSFLYGSNREFYRIIICMLFLRAGLLSGKWRTDENFGRKFKR